jgi:hypothetical protein
LFEEKASLNMDATDGQLQNEAWLDAVELERLADVLDEFSALVTSNVIRCPRAQAKVSCVDDTSDTGIVEIAFCPSDEDLSPYQARVHVEPAEHPRSAWSLYSEDLRELAARLGTCSTELDRPTEIELETVDDGTFDSQDHPSFKVELKENTPTVHLWLDLMDVWPGIFDYH